MTLSLLGWDDAFARDFLPHSAAGLMPARVAQQHKHTYEVMLASGPAPAECTGRLLHASTRAALPAVGDWVAVRPRPGETRVDVHAVLPRRSCLSRHAAGTTPMEQVLAANVDTALVVSALDRDFNLRRIERYLTAVHAGGAQPVIVLNKADLHPDPAAARERVAAIAPGVPNVVLNALLGDTLSALDPWLLPGRTLALLGSSGVGKSTILNRLRGDDHQRTSALSHAVGKGRHTTTHRALIPLPGGALLIDTPGLRELQLWDVPDTVLDTTFADIAALAHECRFRDCTHQHEPSCAVQAALQDGRLSEARWQSYGKLQRHEAFAAAKANAEVGRERKLVWRRINRAFRERAKHSPKHGD